MRRYADIGNTAADPPVRGRRNRSWVRLRGGRCIIKRFVVAGILATIAALAFYCFDRCYRAARRHEPAASTPASEDHTADVQVHDSQRSEQHTEDGASVVDEWVMESFPASDPPQSW